MGDTSSTLTTGVREGTAEESVYQGCGAAPGIALGTSHQYDSSVPKVREDRVAPDEVESELEHLADAVQRAEEELKTIRLLAHGSLDADGEAIFEAQTMMLRDETFLEAIRERIRDRRESAGTALKGVLQRHRERLSESDDEYLRARTGDLLDLEKRLRRALHHRKFASDLGDRSIVLAENLTATDILRLGQQGMVGCVTSKGGATSHASIIAQTLEVPMLVGLDDLAAVPPNAPVILDADQDRLIVHPSPSTVDHYEQRRTEQSRRSQPSGHGVSQALTTDEAVVPLRANIELEEELDQLPTDGGQGIGLLRTEMLLLAGGSRFLSEDRQVEVYRKAAEVTGEAGATIRLLDVGGDKRLPFASQETNPALGWRGIRLLLDRADDLLRPQLRALLRANAHGSLRVLLPMVAELEEVHRVQRLLEEEADRLAAKDVTHDADLPLGIMVEVPAAALRAANLAEHADFFSVGTNDLTQYVLAVDRSNDQVADRYDALHPAVLRLIRHTVVAGQAANCPVEVCGESAADLQAVPVLLGLGVDALSASLPALPPVRRLVQSMALDEARTLADEVLEAPDAETVRRAAREWIANHVSAKLGAGEGPGDSAESSVS